MKPAENSSGNMPNVQRAVSFFRQPVWERLVEALYEKYMAQGRVGGQVVLEACTMDERVEIVRFLNKRPSSTETLVVRLGDFQRALNESGFACELPELLMALYPDRSHVTRPQARQQRSQEQQRFYEALSMILDDLPAETKGRHWLLSGTHGREYLFRRYKNEVPAGQESVLHAVRNVVDALNHLPVPPAYERLSLFAQRIGGDPHRLDAQSLAGRLFLSALQDLMGLEEPYSNELIRDEGGEPSISELGPTAENTTDVPEEETPSQQEAQQQRHLLYYEAGLLADTISSNVTVFQLAYAEDATGQRDPWVEQSGTRVLVLPLRQLLAWSKLAPVSEHIYLFENPQVFEDIVDELLRRARTGNAQQQVMLPTLICTSGWLSAAAVRLLNLCTATVPQSILHYSGDFDLSGLRIANFLQKRYPTHCQLWRFDPASYLAALHDRSDSFNRTDLTALQRFPASFAPLVAAMREQGKKAYQEGITSLLLEEIASMQRDASSL